MSSKYHNSSSTERFVVQVHLQFFAFHATLAAFFAIRLFVRVFGVQHAGCPAVGYVVGTRHAPKLKEEYRGLAKNEIRDLIASGVSIKSQPIDELEVAYTGDTCAVGLECKLASAASMGLEKEGNCLSKEETESMKEAHQRNALYLHQAFQSPLIICEVTFLNDNDQERQLAQDRGHMHIDDILPVLSSHGWKSPADCKVVLLHLSARYGAKQALDEFVRVLPKDVLPHCSVAITSLVDSRQEEWVQLIKDNGCIALADYTKFTGEQENEGK